MWGVYVGERVVGLWCWEYFSESIGAGVSWRTKDLHFPRQTTWCNIYTKAFPQPRSVALFPNMCLQHLFTCHHFATTFHRDMLQLCFFKNSQHVYSKSFSRLVQFSAFLLTRLLHRVLWNQQASSRAVCRNIFPARCFQWFGVALCQATDQVAFTNSLVTAVSISPGHMKTVFSNTPSKHLFIKKRVPAEFLTTLPSYCNQCPSRSVAGLGKFCKGVATMNDKFLNVRLAR